MKKIKKNYWYHVNIPINSNQSIDKIFSLENNLLEKNISFDTGTDLTSRDWELDWSLSGSTPENIFKFLKVNDIEFTKNRVSKK